LSARLPRELSQKPRVSDMAPARHFEFVVDIGEALGIASAVHSGRLVDLVQHLCLDHVAEQLASRARLLRVAAIVSVDNCRRPCFRCEQLTERQMRQAFAS
jgi:hypothetical protein